MSIFSFIIYCFIVTITPGTTNILILSTVQNFGVRAAMSFAYGSVLGFGILLSGSAVLNSIFLNLIPSLIIYVQVLGTVYMLYLAYQVYKMDVSKNTTSTNSAGSFKRGLVIAMLNPKPIIFALTLFPSFILPYYNGFSPLTVAVIGVTMIGFTSFILWVGFGAIFKEILRKYNKVTNIIMALFLLYAAAMIWF
ncbi:LysE family translocator [Metabacillus fastidiosus]|uniref:LysE family translocator n=1 Tax=Metabacillus fastidiosus TaxID=1458 RepID=UPI003D2D174A